MLANGMLFLQIDLNDYTATFRKTLLLEVTRGILLQNFDSGS